MEKGNAGIGGEFESRTSESGCLTMVIAVTVLLCITAIIITVIVRNT